MSEGKIADGWYQFDNDINSVIDGIAGNGVVTGLTGVEDSPAAMIVEIAAGTYVANGVVVVKATATDVTIEAADGSNPRKDLIIGDSSGNITVVKGTAAAAVPVGQTGPNTSTPVPGDITANKTILAEVWVGAGVTTILDANITDRRILLRAAAVTVKDFTELTISSGAISVTQSLHTVDTESDAATDNLDTINGGVAGMWVVLRAENDGRTIVVRHNQDNIWLQGKANVSLDDIRDGLLLVSDGTKWFDISAGGGGGAPAAHGSSHEPSGSDQVHAIGDDDDDTKIQVEESADEDHIRMDVKGVEAFDLQDAGILSLAKQSSAYAKRATAVQSVPTATTAKIHFNSELSDVQNEFDSSHKTGTADATLADHLVDDGAAQFAAADVGATVWNTTDDTYTTVTAYNDAGDLTLDDDIFVNGEDYDIFHSEFTATVAGTYLCVAAVRLVTMTDGKYGQIRIMKNDTAPPLVSNYCHAAITLSISAVAVVTADLAANDTIGVEAYHNNGNVRDVSTSGTYLSVYKLA